MGPYLNRSATKPKVCGSYNKNCLFGGDGTTCNISSVGIKPTKFVGTIFPVKPLLYPTLIPHEEASGNTGPWAAKLARYAPGNASRDFYRSTKLPLDFWQDSDHFGYGSDISLN